MFRVTCPGCSAPYQVDERRVPDDGLRMRCPKCSERFRVRRPEGLAPAESQQGLPEPPSKKPRSTGTMVGIQSSSPTSANKATLTGAVSSGLAKTITGVGPQSGEGAAVKAPGSASSGGLPERGAVPAIGGIPSAPALAGRAAFPGIPRARRSEEAGEAKAALGSTALGVGPLLPAVSRTSLDSIADLPAVVRPATEAELPDVFGDDGAEEPGLPAPFAEPGDASAGFAFEDDAALPATISRVNLELDEDAALPAKIDSQVPPRPSQRGSKDVTGLPAKRELSAPDLPAVHTPGGRADQRAALPANLGQSGLPAGLGQSALPANVGQSGLPANLGESGLPVKASASALPAVTSGSALPARPRTGKDSLVGSVRPELDSIVIEDLPHLPDLGIVSDRSHTLASEGTAASLLPRAVLPELPDLPTSPRAPGGKSLSPVAPTAQKANRSAPTLDLEGAFETVSPRPKDVKRAAGTAPTVVSGAAGGMVRDSFDLDDLPPIGGSTAPSGFGDLDLPLSEDGIGLDEGADSSNVAAAIAAADANPFGDADADDPFASNSVPPSSDFAESEGFDSTAVSDPFGAPLSSVAQASGDFSGVGDELDDDFGEAASPFDDDVPKKKPVQNRAAPGGASYGEVDLGGGEDDSVGIEGGDDGEEFGAIPQSEVAHSPESTLEDRHRVQGAAGLAEPIKLQVDDEVQGAKKRARMRIAVGLSLLVCVGGFALSVVPGMGPFGVYFISDVVFRGSYQDQLDKTVDQAQRALGNDMYPDAKVAIDLARESSKESKRFRPLAAYSAYLHYATVLRFGANASLEAKASVALSGMHEYPDTDKYELALGAQAAVQGKLAEARSKLSPLDDWDALVTLGEVELAQDKFAAALKVLERADKLRKNARTRYGLARAAAGLKQSDQAIGYAINALELNPTHVGARIVVAETKWDTRADEVEAAKLLEEAVASAETASIGERVRASTLLGEIYLARGRISHAETAFAAAVRLDPKSSRALRGFGEAMYLAGRFSQSLSRFQAGADANPEDVECAIGVVKSAFQLSRIAEAETALADLLKRFPNNMLVHHWFAKVYQEKGERDLAVASYKKAIELGGKDAAVVHSYLELAQLYRREEGGLEEAERVLADAQEVLAESSMLHKALGELAVTQAKYEEALQHFALAEQLDPEDLHARFLKGTALRRLGRFDEALSIFDDVSKADAELPGLAIERGVLLKDAGRSEEALIEFEGALSKAPNDADLMLRVGCGRVTAGRGGDAVKLLETALRKKEHDAEANHCLGRALMQGGKLVDAIRSLQRAVEIAPTHADYHLYLGWAANDLGQTTVARKSLNLALELDKGLAEAYWQRGRLETRMGEVDSAVRDIEKALQLKPSLEEMHADLALAYYGKNRLPDAMIEWQRALKANPNEPLWLYSYGQMLFKDDQLGAAITHLTKAVSLVEDVKNPPLWLGNAYLALAQAYGESKGAIPWWKKFLKYGDKQSPYQKEGVRFLKEQNVEFYDY